MFTVVGVNYMSKRYFNYLNDRSVPGRAIVDASLGYRFDAGMRKPVELQINAPTCSTSEVRRHDRIERLRRKR